MFVELIDTPIIVDSEENAFLFSGRVLETLNSSSKYDVTQGSDFLHAKQE